MTLERLASVDAMRAYQREWLESTRAHAQRGGPFILCNSDEFEDILNAFEIPSLVINYWNFVILRSGNARPLQRQLIERGYPGPHFFSLGYATALDPAQAPWGGLPTPRLLVGSSRNDYERRVCELWAEKLGCPLFPIDFNFGSPRATPLPGDWWRTVRTDWRALTDPARVEGRYEQVRAFLNYLERDLGRPLPIADIAAAMERINRQMDIWMEADALIAGARVHPIAFRDQLAMYQAMWHRGRPDGVRLVSDYRDEIAERVARGVAGYAESGLRVLFWSVNAEPDFHAWMRERFGAIIVASPYSAMPAMYARDFDPADPLLALSARHTLLFQLTPEWMVAEAERHRCDLIISSEAIGDHGSVNERAAEAAGIPFLAIPQGTPPADAEQRLERFFSERLGRKPG